MDTNYSTVKSEKIIKRQFSRSPKAVFQGYSTALSAHPNPQEGLLLESQGTSALSHTIILETREPRAGFYDLTLQGEYSVGPSESHSDRSPVSLSTSPGQ